MIEPPALSWRGPKIAAGVLRLWTGVDLIFRRQPRPRFVIMSECCKLLVCQWKRFRLNQRRLFAKPQDGHYPTRWLSISCRALRGAACSFKSLLLSPSTALIRPFGQLSELPCVSHIPARSPVHIKIHDIKASAPTTINTA